MNIEDRQGAKSLQPRTRWRRAQSVANPSLGAIPDPQRKYREITRIQRSRSSQIVDFRLHPGSSAGISLRLITGNRCATSRDLLAGQNLAPMDSEPNPRAMRKPHHRRNSGGRGKTRSSLSYSEGQIGLGDKLATSRVPVRIRASTARISS
jgi:hypothetical protein